MSSSYLYKLPEGLTAGRAGVTSSVSSESLYCCCAEASVSGGGVVVGGVPTRSNSSNALYRGYRCQRARSVDWEVLAVSVTIQRID